MRAPIILSMTTIPSRASSVVSTIGSLLQQTAPFDELRVYACKTNVRDLWPADTRLRRLQVGQDFGPVTKISAVCDPAVPHDAIVVTADDDIIYHRTWLATLLEAADHFPDAACGFSGWNVNQILEHPQLGLPVLVSAPGPWGHTPPTCDILEGFAGIAYRKAWFGPEVLDPPDFARYVDDVWISSLLHRRSITRCIVGKLMVTIGAETGLHNAPDFISRNRRAVLELFGNSEHRPPSTST